MSDDLLLTLAEISAALIGLFLVGMVFYIQTGFDRIERPREVVDYFRASTLITFILFGIPLAISLTLVSLPILWSQILYLVLVVGLIVVNVTTARTVWACVRVTGFRLLVWMEMIGTAVVLLMVVLPLATGGLAPEREDLVPALLLSLGIGFYGTCVLVLTLFDLARAELAANGDRVAPISSASGEPALSDGGSEGTERSRDEALDDVADDRSDIDG